AWTGFDVRATVVMGGLPPFGLARRTRRSAGSGAGALGSRPNDFPGALAFSSAFGAGAGRRAALWRSGAPQSQGVDGLGGIPAPHPSFTGFSVEVSGVILSLIQYSEL